MEAKLAQKLAGIAHKTLLQVFLDVCKEYDLLERGRCLEILRGHNLGPNLTRLLNSYRKWQWIVPKAGKGLGSEFGTERGLTQGEPTPPMIFNIVVDAVVRAVLNLVYSPQEAHHGTGWTAGETNLVFYADAGRIAGWDNE